MKQFFYYSTLFCLSFSPLVAQTSVDLTDDIDVESNSELRINPGLFEIQDVAHDGLIRVIDREQVIIDGTDVQVSGLDTTGYLIYLENSTLTPGILAIRSDP